MEQRKVFSDTDNHVFSLEDLIGRGAQGNIYRGIHKLSGEVHALKMFDKYNLQTQREMEALSQLQHPNIVKFFKCEKDFKGKDVIVMELCEGGSLLDQIRKPQNITGIGEQEFLRVFSHLVSGMKHLRRHGFSHRDIKPGNILVCVGEDGRNIYKLSDFGTAKPLHDNDFFVSLVGTDEYLHPDIYKAAFIDRRRGGGTFTIAADLWSLGATLYHTVTGKVPFNPYTGREDKNVMYEMISAKESGVIAGEQMTAGGSIHWSKNLPKTCRLSRSMNILIKSVLVNLLESDKSKIWSFEEFFVAADDLLNRKAVHWFCSSTCSHHITYLKQEASLSELQDEIAAESYIDTNDQCLLYKEDQVISDLHKNNKVNDIISTDRQTPMLVIDMNSSEKVAGVRYESWEEVVFDEPMPLFELTERTVYDVMRDYQVAKVLCAKIFLMGKIVKRLELSKMLLSKAVHICRKLHKQKVSNLSREVHILQQRLADIISLTELSKKDSFTPISKDGNEDKDDVSLTKERVNMCVDKLSELSGLQVNEAVQTPCEICFDNKTDNERKVTRHIQQSEELLKKFMERRGQRMTVHIEYMHNFDRKHIQEHYRAVQHIMNVCKTDVNMEHESFLEWKRLHLNLVCKTSALENMIKEASSSVNDLVQTLKELNSQNLTIPAIGQKTMRRRQFAMDVNSRVEGLQRDVLESKMLALQSREQLDSLSSLMSDLPDLNDVDFSSLTSKSEPSLTNGIDCTENDMSLESDYVKCESSVT